MSTELKGVTCIAGKMTMTRFWGGVDRGPCVQLTFRRPEEQHGSEHCDISNRLGYWFASLTKDQARELGQALIEFSEDRREEIE